MSKDTLLTVAIASITIGKLNPRKDFNETALKELSESIKEKGILQPILLRPIGKDKYELVCGNRRLLAAQAVGIKEIPAKIEEMSDEQAIEAMIVENMQRVDVHRMEEAAAMKHLIDKKGKTIQDIATTIGKPASYVAQSLKLNDLIEILQKGFLAGDFNVKTAFNVAILTKESQEQIVKNRRYKVGNNFAVSDWDLRQYKQDLKNAPFDTKDPELNKTMGACTNCQHNTASNTVLFPEQAGQSVCLLAKCFQEKVEKSFAQELKKAIEDPSVILICNHHELTSYAKNLSKQHQVLKSGYGWGENSDYEVISKPDKKSIDTGKFNKAYVVDGTNKGTYCYIKIKKKSPGKVKKGSAPEKINVQAEIKRMADAEKRKKEIDNNKSFVKYHEALDNNKAYVTDKPLTKSELIAANIILLNAIGWNGSYDEDAEKALKIEKNNTTDDKGYKKLAKETPAVLSKNVNRLIRWLILDKAQPANESREGHGDLDTAFVPIVREACPKEAKKIQDEQNAEAKKREARLKERIDQLKKPIKKK